jgi:hypothetical protein
MPDRSNRHSTLALAAIEMEGFQRAPKPIDYSTLDYLLLSEPCTCGA